LDLSLSELGEDFGKQLLQALDLLAMERGQMHQRSWVLGSAAEGCACDHGRPALSQGRSSRVSLIRDLVGGEGLLAQMGRSL
jgi:hypothetical protein